MTNRPRVSRRKFLQLSALTGTSLLASACGVQVAPSTPTAPSQPQATAAATSAPTSAGTPAAVATSAATKAPSIGGNLVGKLEGPSIVTDPSKIPAKFAEAPMLADLVKAGKLPAVKDRLPSDPMVVQPLKEIGKYGGTWRRAFTGPADGENVNRILSSDKPLIWDFTGTEPRASLMRDWKISDDGKTTTLFLRNGVKWSDGTPFTADAFLFWYEDIYGNKEITPTPHPDMQIGGKPGVLKKVNDLTVVFEFPDANFLFEDLLAGSTFIGGGQASRQFGGNAGGAYAPGHYLKQFHPKYAGQEQADKLAKDAKFDSWVTYFNDPPTEYPLPEPTRRRCG